VYVPSWGTGVHGARGQNSRHSNQVVEIRSPITVIAKISRVKPQDGSKNVRSRTAAAGIPLISGRVVEGDAIHY